MTLSSGYGLSGASLIVMTAIVRRFIIRLHHYIGDGPSKARSSTPIDTNSQVKRSRQPA